MSQDDEEEPLGKLSPEWQESQYGWRHVLVALIFVVVTICYADRTNIGIVLARHDFDGIPHGDKGSILSAFFIGYFCSQIPGGIVARRWGAKPAFLFAVIVWTTCDVLTPLFALGGLLPLILARVGMGLGEGFVFPTQHTFSNFWVPRHERAFLICCMTGGQQFGSVLANVISPHLLEFSVAHVFVAWAIAALLWVIAFAAIGASAPELHEKCIRAGEDIWIQENRDAPHIHAVQRASAGEHPFPRRLLCQPCVWAIFAGHVGMNYPWYVVLSWMPTFYAEAFDLKLAGHPLLLAIPYLGGLVGVLCAGRISDKLIMRGARIRRVRKISHCFGAVGFALFLQLAARSESAQIAGLWITLSLFFAQLQTAGFWVNMADVCPQTAGTLMGLSNTIATIPGIIGQPITQAILDESGSWSIVFGVGGTVGISAAVIFAWFADDVSLDADTIVRKDSDEHIEGDDLIWEIGHPSVA